MCMGTLPMKTQKFLFTLVKGLGIDIKIIPIEIMNMSLDDPEIEYRLINELFVFKGIRCKSVKVIGFAEN